MINFFIAVITLAAFAIVVWPLVRNFGDGRGHQAVEDTELGEVLAQKDLALLAIEELESDYEMGNLSQKDYTELRNKYDDQAVALLKSVDELRDERTLEMADNLDMKIEAEVALLRGGRDGRRTARGSDCPTCGVSALPGATFCHRCGTGLATVCHACSVAVGADDRFCPYCGAALSRIPVE